MKIKNPNAKIQWLKRNGIPFELRQTLLTKKIITDRRAYSYINTGSGQIPQKELFYISMVKRHAETLKNIPKVDRRQTEYIGQSATMKKGYHYKNLYEIDLTSAYFWMAKKNNFITEELFNRGQLVSKKTRLISLGNLAKTTTILNFNGKEYKPARMEHSTTTENIFWKVAQDTDILMRRLVILAQQDFLFYWVDAIFLRSEKSKDLICEYLTGEGVPFKIKEIKDAIKTAREITIYDHDNKKRVFNFLNSKFIS